MKNPQKLAEFIAQFVINAVNEENESVFDPDEMPEMLLPNDLERIVLSAILAYNPKK